MAHANVVNNELVDDDGMPVKNLSFMDDQPPSKFSDQIGQLASRRKNLPVGWHQIFDNAIRSLRAVDCPKRNGIEISEVVVGQGSMHLETYYNPTDKVVSGILSCLSKRSACTCQACGRGFGAVYRNSNRQTLCSRCHVRIDLAAELDRWQDSDSARWTRRSSPIIEFESLPVNIQMLIPKGRIRSLSLLSGDREISYVTPEDVKMHLDKLGVMKRYMDRLGRA